MVVGTQGKLTTSRLNAVRKTVLREKIGRVISQFQMYMFEIHSCKCSNPTHLDCPSRVYLIGIN